METYDVIVFGSGAAGLTAAFVCAHEGLKTLLCEKTEYVGGTTATSGGVAWIPNNHLSGAPGPAGRDSSAWQLVAQRAGALMRTDLFERFLTQGPDAIRYLERYSALRFETGNIPDYYDLHGSAEVRSALSPRPFDGRLLGQDFGMLRPPYPQFLVLGGLMVGRRDIHALLRPYASLATLRRFCAILVRHVRDRLRYPRGTHLLMGNALTASLLYSFRRAGGTVQTATRLVELESANGRVSTAMIERGGQRLALQARQGIVMATGGFPHSPQLRERYMAGFEHRHSLGLTANTGDAHVAAQKVGAAADDAMRSPGFWTACTVFRERNGREILYPYGHLDRGKPGLVLVDEAGNRFVNESDSYHDVALAMFEQRRAGYFGRFFQICDRRFLWAYGLGFIRPMPISLRRFVAAGYLTRAPTLAALASRIGINVDGLQETVRLHNLACLSGVDPAFGKGGSTFNRYNGDPRIGPNPCLAPIERAPYYAVAIEPASLGCSAGIRVDADANVLGADDRPLPGLYACGNEMGSVVRGEYVGAGITIGPAIVFGYLAARHIVATSRHDVTPEEAVP